MEKTIEHSHINDWYYEGKVSRVIVQYLLKNGYKVTKDNSDRPSEALAIGSTCDLYV